MAKVANIITMVIYYLKGNIIREKDTEKEKNILLMENWNLNGTYSNGQRLSGKIKSYYEDGNIKLEGEYMEIIGILNNMIKIIM